MTKKQQSLALDQLSQRPEHRQYFLWRQSPAAWVRHHIHIDLARYRGEDEFLSWLETQPTDSHAWCRRQLVNGQLTLDSSRSYQAEILDKLAVPGRYALQMANSTAKTATAALAILWFLDCYTDSRVLTTAGTWSQLQEQLWQEIPFWAEHARIPFSAVGRIGRTQINLKPGWIAFGRAADRPETFEGVHAPHIMVLVDEAKAVNPDIFGSIRRILRGNEDAKLWLIILSSPGSPTGPFYDICKGDQAHRYEIFHISAYESERVSLAQIEEDANDLGESSPLFVAMDLGEFPEEGEDTVIPLSWAQAAVGRTVSRVGARILGVDVAHMGSDETVLASLFGRAVELSAIYQGQDTTWTAGRILALHRQHSYTNIGVDAVGYGAGVADQLKANQIKARSINFGETQSMVQPDRYVNLKAEIYYILRAMLEEGFKFPGDPEKGLSLPDDKRLIHQLTMQKFLFDTKLRYKLESHDDLKRRGEKSPDRADAVAIATYLSRTGHLGETARLRQSNRQAQHRGLAAGVMAEKF